MVLAAFIFINSIIGTAVEHHVHNIARRLSDFDYR